MSALVKGAPMPTAGKRSLIEFLLTQGKPRAQGTGAIAQGWPVASRMFIRRNDDLTSNRLHRHDGKRGSSGPARLAASLKDLKEDVAPLAQVTGSELDGT